MPAPSDAALQATGLSFAYGSHTALADLDLTLRAGEIAGVVGPNGSGKTTLLHCLAGVLHGRGTIVYDGVSLASLSPRDRAAQCALMPQQSPPVFPYRVTEVVSMGLAHRHWSFRLAPAGAAVAAVLAELGAAHLAARPYGSLSGGERQLVLLARTLVSAAPRLLLDEPTSALDLAHQDAVIAALQHRRTAGIAVVVALHDLNLASRLCDRVVLLNAGALVADGPPAAVLTTATLRAAYRSATVEGLDAPAIPCIRISPTRAGAAPP